MKDAYNKRSRFNFIITAEKDSYIDKMYKRVEKDRAFLIFCPKMKEGSRICLTIHLKEHIL